jgi:ribonuclease J
MINLTRPKFFIPIHGEYRHLILHARLAEQVGISKENILLAENGQIIEFDENSGRVGESVFTGRVLIDGKGIGDVGRSVLKERRDLSEGLWFTGLKSFPVALYSRLKKAIFWKTQSVLYSRS